MILLSESTEEQLIEELEERFSDFVFSGVRIRSDKNGELPFVTKTHGGYLMRRGLSAAIQEVLQDETKQIYKGWHGE